MKIRLFPSSLFGRITVAFVLIVVLFACAQFGTLYILWKKAVAERTQRMNWDLAETYARNIDSRLYNVENREELEKRIAQLSSYNGTVDILVVDKDGHVLVSSGFVLYGGSAMVDTEVFEEFLAPKLDRDLPLYASGHYQPNHRDVIFSVARIVLDGDPGYLVVLLQSGEFDNNDRSLADFYVIYGGSFSTVIILVLASSLGALLFFFITRRFYRLIAVVKDIAEGDLTKRVEVSGVDEISNLGNQVNKMADTLVETISALEQTDKVRRELVSYVGHDFRQPLASMHSLLEEVIHKGGDLNDDENRKRIDTILRSVKSLDHLSQDLLALSKLDAKEIEPRIEPFSLLDTVTEEIIPRLQPFAIEKDVALRSEHPSSMPFVSGDVAMIERVLTNLIENGINYNKPGGSVFVELREREEDISISIIDTGKGMSEEDLENIFERFYRGSASEGGSIRGTGLGMAFVKKALELHEEDINVESKLGKGTTFSFSLRKAGSKL